MFRNLAHARVVISASEPPHSFTLVATCRRAGKCAGIRRTSFPAQSCLSRGVASPPCGFPRADIQGIVQHCRD